MSTSQALLALLLMVTTFRVSPLDKALVLKIVELQKMLKRMPVTKYIGLLRQY